MEDDEVNLTHKHHAKKVVARDNIQVPVIKEKGRPTKEGYTLKRTHAVTNYEIAYEKLFNEDDHDKYIKELMEALSSGYEKANIQDRCDVGTQTNLKLCEMDDDSIRNVIQDIIFDTSDEFEFKDVYSSEDEEFASVSSEQVQEMLNLEDSKKMLKKTVFGIRTDPVTGRIILVIYDEKGEAEVLPIGQGKVSDTKVIVNPKWADYPEILVTDSEHELLHPISYKTVSGDYDKKLLDKMDVRAVEVTKLFEYKYVDHLDESYSDIEWQPEGLQFASQRSSSSIFSESEINVISQKMKNGFQEKRKKRKYDKSKEINLMEETDSALQAGHPVNFPIDSTKTEHCPVSDKTSHAYKIKYDPSLGESSSVKLTDEDVTYLDDKQTDAEIAIKDKIHSKIDHNSSKMKEVSSKGHYKDEQQDITEQKLTMEIEDDLKLFDGEGLHDRDQHLGKMEEITSKVHKDNGHESDQDLFVPKERDSKMYKAKETYRSDPDLFMKTVEKKIPGEKTGFIKDSDLLIREEGCSKINGAKETHQTDSELSIKEKEPKILGRKEGFHKDPLLFDSKIHEVKETHQTDPNLFIKEEEESNIYDQKRERHETEENFFTKKTEDSTVFVGKEISHREESDFDTLMTKIKQKPRVAKEEELDTLNYIEDLTKVDGRSEVSRKGSKAEEVISAEGTAMSSDHRTSQEPRESQLKITPSVETLIESEKYKTDWIDEDYKEDSGLSIIMPAASTQTSVPGKRASILDTLQRVEEEMRPLKHQLAELQRQMWEIDASYPTTPTSTESPPERPSEPTTSFYSPQTNYVFPSQPMCKCPPGECHPSPQALCRKIAHERQTGSLLTGLPTATELARRLMPPRRSLDSPATSRTQSEDVSSEQSKQSLKKTIGKKK